MSIRLWLMTVVISVSAPLLYSQDFKNYVPARCVGEVPADFQKLSSLKAQEAVDALKDKKMGRKERMDEKSHAISTNFLVDELLSSGQILYGDPMTNYINKIADNLLKDHASLRKELRFYVYRSSIPNAYATHTGIVLISVGLLARVENEAQVAFILAHEIQHYVKKHSLQQYKKAAQLKRNLGNISRVEIDDRLKELYRFSKEAENEADLLGFELMKKTKYNLHEGLIVFEMLRYTQYPFLEITLTTDSFESANYKFPKKIKDDIATIIAKKIESESDEDDDEKSTHPSLTKRINRLKDLLEVDGIPKTGLLYMVSEKDFLNVQRMARCELLLLYVRNADFGKVIYLSKVMDIVYGKTPFTEKLTYMGWYGIAKHKLLGHDLAEYGCNSEKSVGDWRPFLAMLGVMNSKEVSALALRELYAAAAKYPSDPWFTGRRDEIFKLVQEKEDLRLMDFLTFKPDKAEAELGPEEKPSEPAVKNPRNRAKESASGESKTWYAGIFYDLNINEEMRTYFKSIHIEAVETEAVGFTKSRKRSKQKTKTPTIESVAMFEPDFTRYNITGSGQRKKEYFSEEQMQISLSQKLDKMGDYANMPVNIISGSTRERITTEDINQYMILNDWFMERLNNDTHAFALWGSQYTAPVMEGLGSKHLGWVGFRYVITKRSLDPLTLLGSVILYPVLPFYLAYVVTREKEFSYVAVVFNTETGSLSFMERNYLSHRIKGDFLNAQLYSLIYNIQHVKKN